MTSTKEAAYAHRAELDEIFPIGSTRMPEQSTSELVIRSADTSAAALVDAVTQEDRAAVADVLTTLDRRSLYGLSIILASQLTDARDNLATALDSLDSLLAQQDVE